MGGFGANTDAVITGLWAQSVGGDCRPGVHSPKAPRADLTLPKAAAVAVNLGKPHLPCETC